MTENNNNNKDIFFVRLGKLMEQTGKSVNQIERELNFPRNSLHNYKSKRVPSGIRLLVLSQYFEVSPYYLMGSSEKEEIIPVKSYFAKLDESERLKMLKLLQEWLISRVDLDEKQF